MKEPFDVVTGGAGFIGSHICWALLRRGGRVRIIDNLATGRESNLEIIRKQFEKQHELVKHDIRDLEGLRRLIQGARIIYHQAAVPSVQRSVTDPIESHGANVNGTLNVLVAARDAGVKRVVYASSSSVYGDSEELPKREDMLARPLSPYAVTKLGNELYAGVFTKLYKLPTCGLRYFNVFGPRQDPKSEYAAVIPRFITRMLAGESPIIYGDGEQSRDFTFVENVVSANLKAAEARTAGFSVNIACGERYTLNQVVEKLNSILGTRLDPVYEEPRPGDIRHSQADISLAEELIEYQVDISFVEGLRRTVEWFQKHSVV